MKNLTLTVRVGASLDTMQPVMVNDDANPVRILTDSFDGWIMPRVRDHLGAPSSNYFDGSDDMFCIQVSGRFLQPCTVYDLEFGNEFEQPLQLPWGTSVLIKFAQWYDPGLSTNVNAPKPYAFSPLIVTMNRLHVESSKGPVLWPSPNGEIIDEDITILSKEVKTLNERRAFFKRAQSRKAVNVTADQVWHMQFSNPFLNFSSGKIKIPAMEVDVLKYWEGQPLRFFARTPTQILFIVEFDLRRS
ncbi:hypothetical protein BJV82DRAFT_633478 [Fennellomyces sp. T-0311]|nr:hypothetical protein BJV82DRAFT_633478 [Fennellomyces sp. T-0311]